MSTAETEAAAAELVERRNATLSGALVAALAELTVIERGRKAKIETKGGGSYGYSYADLGDVVATTRPVLAQHGIVALTPVSGREGGLQVTVTLLHRSGERETFDPLPFAGSNDPQAVGSLITYYRRYALLAALGIATGDDDDGARGSQAAKAPKPLTVNQAKNYLVSLVGKDEAVHAWEWGTDEAPAEWFPSDVDALAKAWMERPMEPAAAAAPVGEETP